MENQGLRLAQLCRHDCEPVPADVHRGVGQSDTCKWFGNDCGFNRRNDVDLMEGALALQCIYPDEQPAVERAAYALAIGVAIPTMGSLSVVPPIEPLKGASNEKMPPSEATSQ